MPRRRRRAAEPEADFAQAAGCLGVLILMYVGTTVLGFLSTLPPWVVWLGIVVGAFALLLSRRWIRQGITWVYRRVRGRSSLTRTAVLSLSTYGFELYCRDLFQQLGFRAVATRPTADEGVDVTLDAPGVGRGLAQCKRWASTPVGRPVVQQLYGQMIRTGATFGYVITTSRFTREAREWARTTRIQLVDGRELEQLVARAQRRKTGDAVQVPQ